MSDIPELDSMWKEKQDIEHLIEDVDENFIPTREAKMNPEEALIHIEL